MIWLFGEIWAWIVAGFLLGLLIGWWIWAKTTPSAIVDSSTVARLRAELDSCAGALAHTESDLAASVALRRALEARLAAAGTPVISLFLDAPEGEPDDLTVISGIGQRLAILLADLGIFHIRQIAAWTPDDIAEVDARLGAFKGRITRDLWVEQANALL